MSEGPGFYVYVDRAGQYRWRLLAANNRVLADSGESYVSRAATLDAVQLVQRTIIDPRIHLHDDTGR